MVTQSPSVLMLQGTLKSCLAKMMLRDLLDS